MEDIYAITKGKPDEPHRHNYYTVLLIQSAKGKHIIDFHEFDMTDSQVYFISPGQVHQVIEESESIGFIFTFSPDFLLYNDIGTNFIEDLHLFQVNGHSPPLEADPQQLDNLCFIANQINVEIETQTKYTYAAIGAWLKLFLIRCQSFCTKDPETNTHLDHASQTLLRQFKSVLNEQYSTWHKVSQYADHLHITPDHLNATISQLTGQSAKAHIQSKIIIEAKRNLLFSEKTTKEIGYSLGFKEPSHFSQFFKKCTGQSPSNFVKSN